MDVTLKRAADLSRAALDAASKMTIKSNMQVSVFNETPVTTTIQARERLITQMEEVEALLTAAYAIRTLVGQANNAAGVDDLLAERAMLEAIQKRLTAVAEDGASDMTDNDMAARIESLRKRLESGNGFHSETMNVSLVDSEVTEFITDRVAAIRRRLSDIKDRVAGINLNTFVTLNSDTVAVLTKAKLV